MNPISASISDRHARFDALVLPHLDRLLAFAARRTNMRADAEDAVQEACGRAWLGLDELRDPTKVRAWLYRITINVCHDFARKRRRTSMTPFEENEFGSETADFEALGGGEDPETLALHAQQFALLRRALQSLPVKERAALVLRDLEGFSTEEVARMLGSRPVTVRTQVSSARAKVKTYCEKLLRKRGG